MSEVAKQINNVADAEVVGRVRFPNCYPCDTCGKEYKWKGSLVQHQRKECGKDPQYKCHICSYCTHYNSPLRRHLRTVHKITLQKQCHQSWTVSFKTISTVVTSLLSVKQLLITLRVQHKTATAEELFLTQFIKEHFKTLSTQHYFFSDKSESHCSIECPSIMEIC